MFPTEVPELIQPWILGMIEPLSAKRCEVLIHNASVDSEGQISAWGCGSNVEPHRALKTLLPTQPCISLILVFPALTFHLPEKVGYCVYYHTGGFLLEMKRMRMHIKYLVIPLEGNPTFYLCELLTTWGGLSSHPYIPKSPCPRLPFPSPLATFHICFSEPTNAQTLSFS